MKLDLFPRMGCGSSKTIDSDTITKIHRIEIIPRDSYPIADTSTKPTDTPYYSRSLSSPRHTVISSKQTPPHPPHAYRSPVSVAALSVRRKRFSPEGRKSGLISVEPQRTDSTHIAHRQVSAGSCVTTDSGFGEESRGGLSAESARTGGGEAEFITEHSIPSHVERVQNAERPVTPELLIEGTSCLPPLRNTTTFSKLVSLPGAINPDSAQNILEKAPLPPIHSQNIRPRPNSVREISLSPTMELEQDLDIVTRPSSRGGMAFDILLGVPTSKRQALSPIEFSSEGKKGTKKRRSTDKLTKESIDAKLAAAEKRRKEREEEVVKNLIEQREVEERKMKEQYERYKRNICDKEANLGERMRTTSVNREVQISAKVFQAQKVKEKVENARQARKSVPLQPQD